MRYFPGEAFRSEADEPGASYSPEFGQDVIVNECGVLDLAIQAGDGAELCLCASICLVFWSASRIQPAYEEDVALT